MSNLAPSSSVSEFFDAANYTIARLEAQPKAIVFVPMLQPPLDHLSKVTGERNQKANAQQKLLARRDSARDNLTDAYEPFGLQAAAHFGSKSAPGLLRIVALTAAQFAVLPLKALPGVLAQLKSAIDDPATPAEVKKFAKPVFDAWDAFEKAQGLVAAGVLTMRKASKAVDDGKVEVLNGLAKVRAALAGANPRQPKVVARYFVKSKAKRAKEEAAAEADPAGQI